MIENTPLVTVGIPTYNRPKGLERILECILNQNYRNLEVIVSDNCSDDPKVLEILEKYKAFDNRVSYYVQERNISIVPNFQFLLDKAAGDFFMWSADDDYYDINFIEACAEGLIHNNEVVACITDVKIVGLDSVARETKLKRSFMQKSIYGRSFFWTKSPEECKYFFCGLYRSAAVKNITFPNIWGGDHMFLLEVITKGKFLYIPGKSNLYYFRGGSSGSIEKVRKAFGIKKRIVFFDWYFIRYCYYPFRFKHLNKIQRTGLFISNSLGLLLNEEGILFRILIVKPIKGVLKKVSKIFIFRQVKRKKTKKVI
jgi:glycosyltransferase involved in cell wall biosynthesis